MAVNSMQITDIYQTLNSIHNQATGRTALAPTNTAEFVSQATTTLGVGTDIVYNVLMDAIMRPIFAVRDYNEKFSGLYVTNEQYGAIMRKISYADKPAQEADAAWNLPVDGQSVDHWKINRGIPLEMRFFGSAVYKDWLTITEDQLKTAFSSPDELGGFITGQMTAQNNKYKQWRENLSRACLANFIGAKNVIGGDGVVHLITEYNAKTGLSLTAQDIYKPDNVDSFFRWVRSRVNTLGRMMRERSGLYQQQIGSYNVNRHTENQDLKIYMNAEALDIIDAMVNTITYHDEPLAYADVEGVTYWQDILAPDSINVTPSYTDTDGTVKTGEAQNITRIFGVMFDRDAVAINRYMYEVRNTPLNASGLYFNTYLHDRTRYINDVTEKGIVLLLD